MEIKTELKIGERGHFLIDNKVEFKQVLEIRVTATTHEPKPKVEYCVSNYDGVRLMVEEHLSGNTKANLLAKL